VGKFFELRYDLRENFLDEHGILKQIEDGASNFSFQFREMAHAYKLIDDKTVGIIIPFDEKCRAILHDAEATIFPKKYLRKLQRYSVSIYGYELDALQKRGCIYELVPGIFVLNEANFMDCYDGKLGLVSDGDWSELII
jgi:CRISPR-associated endonuclease/helicase Cas3